MADNGTAASGPTIAWDDIGGVAYQRVKVTFGAAPTDVDAGAGLPVAVQGDVPVTIAGTVAVSGALTDTQIRATPLPVSGAVTTGGLTDTQLRASAVPVSLTSTTVTGTVAITDNAGSLTVDAPVGTPAFVRLSDGAAAIGTLPVSLAINTPTIGAGSAIIGKVGIDQTTPGTTNLVSIGSNGTVTLLAGSAAIGKLAANTGVTIGAVEIAASQTLATVTNLSQLGGAAIAMGTGVRSAGTQRVTIATDDVVPVTMATAPALVAGTALIGKVGLDQTTPGTTNAVSVAQIGATTVATGNGVVSAGVQRVAIASDNTAFSVNATLQAGTAGFGKLTANSGVTIGAVEIAAAQTLGTVTTVGTVTTITNAVTVTPPTLTKATQGSTGFSTQDLKDAGRTSIMVTASVATTATSETLITITTSKGLASTGTSTSTSITTGKRFRIQGIFASARNTTGTTAGVATIRLRAAVGGATSASSPLQLSSSVALPAAATSVNFPTIDVPDGFEIDSNGATNTWGLTILHPQWVTGSVVATFDISLIGYEY